MIDAADAVSIATLINAAISGANAKITPVLSEILVTITGGKVTAAATDRFTAAIYDTEATGSDGQFRITPAGAKFITANVKRVSKHYTPEPVEFTYDQELRELGISHGRAVFGDTWQPQKYPDIINLANTWQPADKHLPVKLRGEFLARLYKFLDSFARVDYWLLEIGRGSEYKPDKPGAVMATAGKFRVMIQPNIYSPADTI